jgi:hypothetical protein
VRSSARCDKSDLQYCCTGPTGPLSPTSTEFAAGVGNQYVVTYTFSPPNGQWRPVDAGVWSVDVVEGEVSEYMATPQSVPARSYVWFAVKSKAECALLVVVMTTQAVR